MSTTKKVWMAIREFIAESDGKTYQLNPILFSNKKKAFDHIRMLCEVNKEVIVNEECTSKEFQMYWITANDKNGAQLTHVVTQEEVY